MISGSSLSEQEDKISTLERSNFDMKMQIFYLNQKLSESQSSQEEREQNLVTVNVIEDNNANILALKEENEYSKRRIEELESQLLQLQILRDKEILEYQKVIQEQPADSIAMLEDSRKREREISKAIAEHDAQIIAKLQMEVESLQKQHEGDLQLVEDWSSKVSHSNEVIERNNADIEKLKVTISELENRVSILSDAARCQEILHNNNNANDAQELQLLRQENIVLRDQLQRQNTSIMNQADALNKLREATNQMAAMENEDTQRLGLELDKCLDEKEKLLQKCQQLEVINDSLKLQLSEADRLKQLDGPLKQSHDTKTTSRVGRNDLGNGENISIDDAIDSRSIEMFKKREEELVNALEGVIERCQMLEIELSKMKELQRRVDTDRQQQHRRSQAPPRPPTTTPTMAVAVTQRKLQQGPPFHQTLNNVRR
mmetsp:Transcript_2960/g.5041  ORF Transcript_2960/g.5041 Transcript_2960/m.5041 type:complete len:430 (+) Transcript_2960:67-1356(+)